MERLSSALQSLKKDGILPLNYRKMTNREQIGKKTEFRFLQLWTLAGIYSSSAERDQLTFMFEETALVGFSDDEYSSLIKVFKWLNLTLEEEKLVFSLFDSTLHLSESVNHVKDWNSESLIIGYDAIPSLPDFDDNIANNVWFNANQTNDQHVSRVFDLSNIVNNYVGDDYQGSLRIYY